MSGRNGLITTTELAEILDQPDLRLFDCTTYLEPPPEGSASPISRCPATHVRGRPYAGRGLSDLQGEFSNANTELRFMMPDIVRFSRWTWRQRPRSCSIIDPDVGDAVVVVHRYGWKRLDSSIDNGSSKSRQQAAIRRERQPRRYVDKRPCTRCGVDHAPSSSRTLARNSIRA